MKNNRKKRVIQIGPSIYHANGGMSTVINDLYDSDILNEKYEIDVHASYIDGFLFKRLLFSIVSFIKFAFEYRKYDIFHIHLACNGSTFRKRIYVDFLKKRNKKVVLHVHGAEYKVFYNSLNQKKKKIVENMFNKVDKVIVLSDTWKEYFAGIFPYSKIEVVNNGINIDKYDDIYPNCKNKHSFLFLGRLSNRKGVYDLIDAIEISAKSNPTIHFFLAGDGDVDKVRNIVKDRNLSNNITVTGWISKDEKIEYLRRCQTLVLPSYNEGLPMAILEAMASRKMIISTSVGAIPEVIKNDINGIIVEPGNVDQLVDAIVYASNNFDISKDIGNNNNVLAKNMYSREVMHGKIGLIYEGLGD
ncbi:MAG: glycosyltransferase family 4 protein [Peptostreptococcus porci]|uniref:glycosyltransferase family 4 protein n=1 Tax=Peptostreptococcus porci TaxID=2652282 RepID=UPI002A91C91B|nr:glycosyltransferase family 4 protein [Peptostreptococcus porci]MDY5478889.1 glycosyltransferase family 4 protein [Peptostreptococcus porci]